MLFNNGDIVEAEFILKPSINPLILADPAHQPDIPTDLEKQTLQAIVVRRYVNTRKAKGRRKIHVVFLNQGLGLEKQTWYICEFRFKKIGEASLEELLTHPDAEVRALGLRKGRRTSFKRPDPPSI